VTFVVFGLRKQNVLWPREYLFRTHPTVLSSTSLSMWAAALDIHKEPGNRANVRLLYLRSPFCLFLASSYIGYPLNSSQAQ
jgi:hypothetical protein